MELVILTALGVGGATLVGAIIGFAFKNISHKVNDMVLSFAAGIMLSAAVVGLILPSFEDGNAFDLLVTVFGVFCGAFVLNIIDKLVPHLHKLVENDYEKHKNNSQIDKIMLYVLAIAIHNFPEGIAAGVGFGAGNHAEGIIIAGGIALQNIPEGMIIIAPLISVGVSRKKALTIAAGTGLFEVVGTLVGYLAISLSKAILPFALSFAGGTMLYIISDEMIPETHAHGNERAATFSLLFGFCLMLAFDFLI